MFVRLTSMASAWREDRDADDLHARRQSGAALHEHLLALYALCKLSARDLCVAMHHCANAGVPGARFRDYAVEPGKQSGEYQRHLDRVMPPLRHVYQLSVVGCQRRRAQRCKRVVPARCFWETLTEEYLQDPLRVGISADQPMCGAYNADPLVVAARAAGLALPLSLAATKTAATAAATGTPVTNAAIVFKATAVTKAAQQ